MHAELSSIRDELGVLEAETFEIQDHTDAAGSLQAMASCSTSCSCCSSSSTSCTSCSSCE